MDVTIQGLNLKVSEAIEEYAKKKLGRLDRYLPGISDVRLDLSHENSKRGGNIKIAQLTIRHRRGAILRAEERVSGEIELAINQAVEKMYRRIERFKGKRIDRRSRFAPLPEELETAEQIPAEAGAIDEEAEQVESLIVRRKDVEVVAMNEEEAAEQMELLGHSFFMFYNMNTNAINVIYKRTSGGYGLLVPSMQ